MPLGDEDWGIFFDTDDFAVRLLRIRDGAPDLEFAGIVGKADEEELQGYALLRATELRIPPASDVLENDRVQVLDKDGAPVAGELYRVKHEPIVTSSGGCITHLEPVHA